MHTIMWILIVVGGIFTLVGIMTYNTPMGVFDTDDGPRKRPGPGFLGLVFFIIAGGIKLLA